MISCCYLNSGEPTKPFICVKLPIELPSDQKLAIIKLLNEFYSSTDQDRKDWTSEFEMWVCSIAFDNAIPINTHEHHLDLRDDELVGMITGALTAKQNRMLIEACLCNEDFYKDIVEAMKKEGTGHMDDMYGRYVQIDISIDG